MITRVWSAAGVAAVTAALTLGVSAPASAQQLEVFAGPSTFDATSEGGTGAMTSRATSTSSGGDDPEHPNQFVSDSYGRVAAQTPVERLATYRVTVTFEGARTAESATGQGATARGFGEVQLWDCCFAGEQTLIRTAETDLPSTAGDAEVVMELTPSADMTLNVQALLHSKAITSTAYAGQASVESSAIGTSIDVTQIAEAPAAEPTPQPRRTCLLFVCL